MKKIFALAAAAMMALAVNAQVYVGAGLGFNYNKTEDVKTTQFVVIPEVGYNINENVAVGADFGFLSTKVGDADAQDAYQVDVYGRYNFAEAGAVKFFGEVAVGYQWASVGDATPGFTTVAVRPGVSVDLGKGASLVGRFNLFQYGKGNEDAGKISSTSFGLLGGDSSLSVGVLFNI